MRYLREAKTLIGILTGKKPTEANNKSRIGSFVTSHNTGGLDLIGLSRKMAADTKTTNMRGGIDFKSPKAGGQSSSGRGNGRRSQVRAIDRRGVQGRRAGGRGENQGCRASVGDG